MWIMSCFIRWRFQGSGCVLLVGFWVVHHVPLSLGALLHPLFFFFLPLFCYLNPRRWNFLSPWLFVDSYDQSSSRSRIFGAFFHLSRPASILRRIQIKASRERKDSWQIVGTFFLPFVSSCMNKIFQRLPIRFYTSAL